MITQVDPGSRGARRAGAGDVRALEAELLLLRKYGGFVPARVAKAPALRQVLGASETFEMLRERFVSAIQSLRDPEPELLSAVYRLSDDTAELASLDERRRHYGLRIGRSAATVADQEVPAIEHLRSQLITGWYPKSPLPVRVPTSHNGFITEAVSIRTVVNDRRWHETTEYYRLFAAFDEADYITISSSFPGRPEVTGGNFTVRTQRIGESYSHQFWHKTPMHRGEFYDLRFRLTPDQEFGEPELITEISRAFHEPTRYASFEVVFVGGSPPSAWAYEDLTFFERPGQPKWSSSLELSKNFARLRLVNKYGGLFSGIAWSW